MSSKTCPTCREEFEIKSLNRKLRAILEKTEVRCTNNGCPAKETMSYKAILTHADVCSNKELFCPLGCLYGLSRTSAESAVEHLQTCPKALVICNLCKDVIPRENLAKHDAEKCREVKIPCQYCKIQIKRKNQTEHFKLYCEEKTIKCQNCFDVLRRKNLQEHKNVCPDEVINCTTCMIQYKRKNKDHHTCLKAMTQFFT
jgi:hypothetical protein